MSWYCATCGVLHEDAPTCFGIEAPWRALVPEKDFSKRVDLTADQCVVDREHFFVRGQIEIPIIDTRTALAFSVWSSLSEASFIHMSDRWSCEDRYLDPPYFGWLSSPIPVYPSTIHLKLSVQTRKVGSVPLFTVERDGHPFAEEQSRGITVDRWHEIVHYLMHG